MTVPGPARCRLLALALAAALGCAACGGIPATGPVVAGHAGDLLVAHDVLSGGPQPADGPVAIVRGYLGNQGNSQESYAVARDYLVNGQRWSSDSVTIYPDQTALQITPLPRTAPDAVGVVRVRVSAPVVATVDAWGAYHGVRSGGQRWSQVLELTRVAGLGWRILNPPDGRVLSQADFDYTFVKFPVYFPDRSGSYLLPDLRWFVRGTAATLLVQALLQGPSPWLAPAVTTGVPPGTKLAVPVVVSEDVAMIDLTPQALAANPLQRQFLAAQLRATLAAAGVSNLRLTVHQAVFDTGSQPGAVVAGESAPSLTADPQIDPRPLVLDSSGHIARIEAGVAGTAIVPVKGLDRLAVPGAALPGSDATGSSFTVLAAERGTVLQAVPSQIGPAKVLITGKQLTAPSTDPRGWVWSASGRGDGAVFVAKPGDRSPATLKVDWLKGLDVVSLKVSRDGARVLVGANGKGRGWLYAASVVREPAGQPGEIGQPVDLLPDLRDVVDASWVDALNVAVIGRRAGAGSPNRPLTWALPVGGPAVGLAPLPVPGARTIAGDGPGQIWVATFTGQIFEFTGQLSERVPGDWSKVPVHATWVSMPG